MLRVILRWRVLRGVYTPVKDLLPPLTRLQLLLSFARLSSNLVDANILVTLRSKEVGRYKYEAQHKQTQWNHNQKNRRMRY